jgi:hypothetical protein
MKPTTGYNNRVAKGHLSPWWPVVARLIVLPQEADGKPLGPNSRVLFLRRKGRAACKPANIRQVLLKFILGPTFHSSSDKKHVSICN